MVAGSVAGSGERIGRPLHTLVVEQMIDSAIEEDTECIVMGLGGQPADVLRALDALRRVPDGRIAVTMDDEREVARRILDGRTR